MESYVICRKSKKCYWEFIGCEIVVGLMFLAMIISTFAIPVEPEAFYVKYIFAAISAVLFIFLIPIVVSHIVFARLPEVFLAQKDETHIHDYLGNTDIRIRDIKNTYVKISKNKYGHPYSYGTLIIVTGGRVFRIKKVDDPYKAQEYLENLIRSTR